MDESWPIKANTNGRELPKERKSPAVGLAPGSYATIQALVEAPVTVLYSRARSDGLILCQP